MLQHLPNAITLLNLFFGCVGIYACATNDYQLVPYCMAAALIADFLDGYLARMLKVKSDLGAQLDSLADNVTFGVLPGMMLLQLISMSTIGGGGGSYMLNPLGYLAFIYSIFACLRLAKFNLDTRQTEGFIGMPTPAGGIFVLGLYLYFFEQDFSNLPSMAFKLIYQPWTLLAIIAGLSWLMISEIPMFSLKGNLFQWKGNQVRMVFLVVSALLLIGLGVIGLTAVILLYVLVSAMAHFAGKQPKVEG
jgi:CDP-diacylglycerol---serine O-phosphatidyltransferase